MDFSLQLKKWYNIHQRELPWRGISDPYLIWLSEIILQQTRIDQGTPYYFRFISRFPTVKALAEAPEDDVLSLWQGLGYYSRARNLHFAAKVIEKDYNGIFPADYKSVKALKGIGDYTAAAIMSFAYNQPYAAVDGNVYRVLSRYFGIDKFIDTNEGKKYFTDLANSLIDKQQPDWFNHAMMDFGALQCTPKKPNCAICPFCDGCVAFNTSTIDCLPKKQGRVKIRTRYLYYFDIRVQGDVFLKKRESGDIWEGLYEFPMLETDQDRGVEELLRLMVDCGIFSGGEDIVIANSYVIKHILTHQKIFAVIFQLNLSVFNNISYKRVPMTDLGSYAMPRLLTKYLENKI